MSFNRIMQIENIQFSHLEKKSGGASFWCAPATPHLWSVASVFVCERERDRKQGKEKKIENQYVAVNVDIVLGHKEINIWETLNTALNGKWSNAV